MAGYAITTFGMITNLVGLGGLLVGLVFFRSRTKDTAPAQPALVTESI
jgi:hypothetical protein